MSATGALLVWLVLAFYAVSGQFVIENNLVQRRPDVRFPLSPPPAPTPPQRVSDGKTDMAAE